MNDREAKRELMKLKMANRALEAEIALNNNIYKKLFFGFVTYIVVFLSLNAENIENAAVKAIIPAVAIIIFNFIGIKLGGLLASKLKKDEN